MAVQGLLSQSIPVYLLEISNDMTRLLSGTNTKFVYKNGEIVKYYMTRLLSGTNTKFVYKNGEIVKYYITF